MIAAERGAVVEWLRGNASIADEPLRDFFCSIADSIERGDHQTDAIEDAVGIEHRAMVRWVAKKIAGWVRSGRTRRMCPDSDVANALADAIETTDWSKPEVADLDAECGGGAVVIMVGDRVDVSGRGVGMLRATRTTIPGLVEVDIAHRYVWVRPDEIAQHHCKPRHSAVPNECACGWRLVDGAWGER